MPPAARRSLSPLILIALGLLLMVGAAYMAGILPGPSGPGPVSAPPTEDPLSGIPRVSLADAKAAFDSGEAVFVDVRDAASFERDHIPGALSIPLNEIAFRMNELDPEDWIITY